MTRSAAAPSPSDPLHEFHLTLAGREWTVLHAGAVAVSHDDESRYLRDVREKHGRYLGNVAGVSAVNRLVELNVAEQVINVAHTTIVRDAWERGQPLTIHSWVYGVHDGLLRDLGITVSSHAEIAPKLEVVLKGYRDGAGE